MSTKLPVLADAHGQPGQLVLGPGQQPDCRRAIELLGHVRRTRKMLADTAYDTTQVVAAGAARGAEAVMPSQPWRRVPRVIDQLAYWQRNGIERLMRRLKQFRPRYDKTASSYLGFVHLICALLSVR